MFTRAKTKHFLKRFKNDSDGTMLVSYAAGLMAMLGVTGLAYDASQYYVGKETAQHRADMIALAATANIRDNGLPEEGDDFAHGVTYYLDDYGLEITPYTSEEENESGERLHRTEFKVLYGVPEEGMLTTHVKSVGKPAILSLFKIDDFVFESDSITSYLREDLKDPASVFFVLDNSGSMSWDDDDGNVRLEGLQEAVTDFNEKLEGITDAFDDANYLRTALWAYSSVDRKVSDPDSAYSCTKWYRRWGYWYPYWSTCYSNETVLTDGDAIFIDTETAPQWGTIGNATIDAMQAFGGTDPSGALEHAKLAMRSEESIHYSENAAEDIHKFVIFMTDGANSSTSITNDSLSQCTTMKNEGVTIYTIGYAIDSGSTPEAFMKSCASSDDHYILAENADVLNTAFDDIGEDILEEVIRIQS